MRQLSGIYYIDSHSPERSEPLAIRPHQAASASPEWIRIATKEIPTTVVFPTIPNTGNCGTKYQETSEGEPACAGFRRLKFVPWCFCCGENSRRYRNGDDTTEVVSDDSEDEDRQQKKAYSCASVTSPVMAVRPIYGFVGIEMSFNVKQSLHSSPVDIKTRHQIKSS